MKAGRALLRRTRDRSASSSPQTRVHHPLNSGSSEQAQDTLAERAQAVREGRAEPMKLDKEVMDAMFGTKVTFLQTVVRYLKEAIADADEARIIDALHELESEVTDIDNANDLDHKTVDGLEPVLKLLSQPHPSADVRTAALWVVGTIVQSNPTAQQHMIAKSDNGINVMQLLLEPLREASAAQMAGADAKLLSKALYALGSLLRGAPRPQEVFVAANGPQDLMAFVAAVADSAAQADDVESEPSPPQDHQAAAVGEEEDAAARAWLPVKRKAVALVGDLAMEHKNADSQGGEGVAAVRQIHAAFSALAPQSAAASVLRMLGSSDRELEEKTLAALLALLRGPGTAGSAAQILVGPAAAAKLDGTRNRAQRHLAAPDADGESWEEVVLLAEQVIGILHNATAQARASA